MIVSEKIKSNSERTINIAVSSCLLGEPVRYDGTTKQNLVIHNQYSCYFNLISICPEMAIGLGVPRAPIKIVENPNNPVANMLVDRDDLSLNYTNKMLSYANQSCEDMKTVCGYVVKERSPSCGLHKTPQFSCDGEILSYGAGLFTDTIKDRFPWLPIITDFDLLEEDKNDNFLERVFVLNIWNKSNKKSKNLVEFNTIIAHQIRLRGKEISSNSNIDTIMTILKIPIDINMQISFLVSQLEEFNISSKLLLDTISRYKDGKLLLWSVIQEFQKFFRNEKIEIKSNYFYPDAMEVLCRKNYFGH